MPAHTSLDEETRKGRFFSFVHRAAWSVMRHGDDVTGNQADDSTSWRMRTGPVIFVSFEDGDTIAIDQHVLVWEEERGLGDGVSLVIKRQWKTGIPESEYPAIKKTNKAKLTHPTIQQITLNL